MGFRLYYLLTMTNMVTRDLILHLLFLSLNIGPSPSCNGNIPSIFYIYSINLAGIGPAPSLWSEGYRTSKASIKNSLGLPLNMLLPPRVSPWFSARPRAAWKAPENTCILNYTTPPTDFNLTTKDAFYCRDFASDTPFPLSIWIR